MTQPLPLTGIRVVDYSHFLAGPFLSRCLAAMGADVIKVERPKAGDAGRAHAYFVKGQSGYFIQQNMGKRGLCINLKDKRGLAFMHRLVKTADVFVENYRPGSLEKLGLGYAELSKFNPRLVYCSVSAFGHTGPDSARPGFGLIAEAKSGAMAQVGVPGEAPPLLRMPLADMYTGIHGVAAICAALYGRVTSGKGQHIDMALLDVEVAMLANLSSSFFVSGVVPGRMGNAHMNIVPYHVFRAADEFLIVAVGNDSQFATFCRVAGAPEWAADPRFATNPERVRNRDLLVGMISGRLRSKTAREWLAALEPAGVPCGPINDLSQVFADPQVRHRGMEVRAPHPAAGEVRMVANPMKFSATPIGHEAPPPTLGQHTDEILGSVLGMDTGRIGALRSQGVI